MADTVRSGWRDVFDSSGMAKTDVERIAVTVESSLKDWERVLGNAGKLCPYKFVIRPE